MCEPTSIALATASQANVDPSSVLKGRLPFVVALPLLCGCIDRIGRVDMPADTCPPGPIPHRPILVGTSSVEENLAVHDALEEFLSLGGYDMRRLQARLYLRTC